MRYLMLGLLLGAWLPTLSDAKPCAPSLDFTVETLTGGDNIHLCEVYQGKVVVVVNTASKCGFTGQYEGLEDLYARYKDQGLVVLGFPSNDFGNQEPGSGEEIAKFCRATFGVKFPMFAKTSVRAEDASPFYAHLIAATGSSPGWNFHKYLIDREGRVVASFPSQVAPASEKFISAIEALL